MTIPDAGIHPSLPRRARDFASAAALPRGVLFDLDDTLFDHAQCAHTALTAVHQRHVCFASMPFEDFEQAHTRLLESLHARVLSGEIRLDDARMERFRSLFEIAGLTADQALVRSAAMTYRDCYLSERRAVAGAQALLVALYSRVRIAIVSNNLRAEQEDKLRRCELDRFVDVLVVSEEVGMSKPDPEIFRIALQRLGCTSREAVMIGDSWQADIVGARTAGMPAIWFNRAKRPCPDPDAGVIELHSLEPPDHVIAAIARTHALHRAHRD
jgi:HAD superfamily hydrolase (TIGR01549 family)